MKITIATIMVLFLVSGCTTPSLVTVYNNSTVTNTVTKHTNGIEANL